MESAHIGIFILCADDGIGRFHQSTLSQQTLMELFIFGLDNPESICGSRDYPTDISTWRGVGFNQDGEVNEFIWASQRSDEISTLRFEYLPRRMQRLDASENTLSGTIKLADLPETMECLHLHKNHNLSGSLDLDSLPAAMQKLTLNHNKFTGEISLENLPQKLEYLDLAENELTGAVCLTSLAPPLEYLNLGGNNLKGSLNLTQLPDYMELLFLHKNAFSGTIDLGHLPRSLIALFASSNNLSCSPGVPIPPLRPC